MRTGSGGATVGHKIVTLIDRKGRLLFRPADSRNMYDIATENLRDTFERIAFAAWQVEPLRHALVICLDPDARGAPHSTNRNAVRNETMRHGPPETEAALRRSHTNSIPDLQLRRYVGVTIFQEKHGTSAQKLANNQAIVESSPERSMSAATNTTNINPAHEDHK